MPLFFGIGFRIRIGSRSVFSLKCCIRIRIKWIRIRNFDFVVLDGFYRQYRTEQESQLLYEYV
jgi:hypothetical protein